MMDQKPQISAVVCTHNRVNYLQACIESLQHQTLDPARYEILIVDNGSTDGTEKLCTNYQESVNFRYIKEPMLGLSHARNRGLLEATGDFIGYIDDDAAAAPQWLEKALEVFALDPVPDWVGGSVTLVWEAPPPPWLTDYYYGALGWVNWGEDARYLDPESEWLVGCNSLFRRATLENYGGFDVRLGRKKNLLLSGEEVQLHHKLRAAGGTFYYHPAVHVHHSVPRERVTPEYFYRRYYWGGVTDYVMTHTLPGTPSQVLSEETKGSRLGRLTTHGIQSLGVGVDVNRKIQSRIYLAYAVGYVVAMLKYGWKGVEH
jgi:glycosyltransferase involved in cell wall biosynthesis